MNTIPSVNRETGSINFSSIYRLQVCKFHIKTTTSKTEICQDSDSVVKRF